MTKPEIIRKAKQIIEVMGVKCVAFRPPIPFRNGGRWWWYSKEPWRGVDAWFALEGSETGSLPSAFLDDWPGPWQETLITADTPEEE